MKFDHRLQSLTVCSRLAASTRSSSGAHMHSPGHPARRLPLFCLPALLVFLLTPCQAPAAQDQPPGDLELYNSEFTSGLLERSDVQIALDYLEEDFDRQVEEWITITEIPAPSGQEKERAAYLREQIEAEGLETRIDSIGNLIARRPGTGDGPTLVLAPHMDTVFPMDTDVSVTVNEEEGTLHAPGVFDNSNSLANMLAVIRALNRADIQTRGDLIFVATAQEEVGVKGMAHWLDNNPGVADMVVAMDGGLGSISYGALGIKWTRFTFYGEGAHTLHSPGQPHPARAQSRAISAIYEQVPMPDAEGGAIYNVGMVDGGDVFNAIPQEVSFTVDLRSVNPDLLDEIDRAIIDRVVHAAEAENVDWDRAVEMHMPAGGTEEELADRADHPLVHTAVDLQRHFDVRTGEREKIASGSTDANAAVVRGYPAISIGRAYGGNQHTLDEWADIDSALKATKQVLLLAVSLTEPE